MIPPAIVLLTVATSFASGGLAAPVSGSGAGGDSGQYTAPMYYQSGPACTGPCDRVIGTSEKHWVANWPPTDGRSDCPELEQLTLPSNFAKSIGIPGSFRNGVADDVGLLGSGAHSCVYGIRWLGKYVAAVKATDKKSTMVEERTVLSKLGDFYGYTNPSPNQWYSFMRFYDGVQIWKSDGWKQYVSASGGFYRDLGKDQNQCTQFFLNYFKDVSSKAAAMAVQVGQIHEDVHAGNVLIPQAYPSKQEPVNIIDWEMINPTDPNATTQQNYQTAYNVAYERLSTTLPYQQMCSGESGVFADVDKSVAWKWAGQLTTDETSTSGINGP